MMQSNHSSNPLVSVCIGSFNRECYIRECVDSVLAQTYPNLEVIVVDDASTDNTLNILESYGDRIRLIKRQENSGMCSITRNQACREANGKYIALLDSDDSWEKSKIQKQVDFLESHHAIPLCHTVCFLMDQDSKITGVRHEDNLPESGPIFAQLLEHCWITISSVMFRRDLLETVGPFLEDPVYGIWGEDLDFFLRVTSQFPVGLVPERLTRYRQSSCNFSHGNWKQAPESVPYLMSLLPRKDFWSGVVSLKTLRSALARACLKNSQFWRDSGYSWRALYFSALAIRCHSANRSVWAHTAKSVYRVFVPHQRDKSEV